MSHVRSIAVAAMASLTLLATTACVTPPPISPTIASAPPEVAPVTEEPAASQPSGEEVHTAADAARAAALQAYVDAEVATIPQIIEGYDGMYADVSITGAIENATGDGEIPVGDFAVMRYDYTYANSMDWAATSDALESQRSVFDEACASQVFPSIEAAGVEGPFAAVYSYRDTTTSGAEPMWSHTCIG